MASELHEYTNGERVIVKSEQLTIHENKSPTTND